MAYGKLKVDKIQSTSEELTLPTSVGTDGQVLTTDGNGVLSFEDNAATDLTATANGTSLTIESSSGNNVALPAATSSAWGVMSDEDKTKLDGIAASANNYSISSDLLDEDNFATNSATKPASQQSIKAYVDSEVTALIGGAPGALDTLSELSSALDDDSSYATTITTALGLKAPKASPTFTGTVAIPNIADLESAVTANTAKVTNVTTDLAVTRSGSAFTVTSSDGTNASLPLADTDNWGLMSDEQFDKLAAIETSATADQTGAEIKTAYEAESDTNAYTDAEKTKLSGVATSANNYSHPSYDGDDFSVDTGALTGATVVSDIDINVTTDGSGHVTDTNGSVSTRTLTLADLGYTGASNANNYSHPSYNGDDFSVDTGALSGATVVSDIDINVTTDGSGHVTDANGSVSTRTLTLSNLGYTGATNANYITNNNQLSNGSNYTASDSANTFTKGQAGSIVTLSDSSTITPNFNSANNFKVTLGGSRNLANPSNLVAGQSGVITVTQDATGTRLLTYGSYWKFTGATVPTLTTTGGATDVISYYVASTTLVYAKVTLNLS